MVASMTGMDEQMHRLKRESASHMDEQLDLTAQLDDAAGQLEEAAGHEARLRDQLVGTMASEARMRQRTTGLEADLSQAERENLRLRSVGRRFSTGERRAMVAIGDYRPDRAALTRPLPDRELELCHGDAVVAIGHEGLDGFVDCELNGAHGRVPAAMLRPAHAQRSGNGIQLLASFAGGPHPGAGKVMRASRSFFPDARTTPPGRRPDEMLAFSADELLMVNYGASGGRNAAPHGDGLVRAAKMDGSGALGLVRFALFAAVPHDQLPRSQADSPVSQGHYQEVAADPPLVSAARPRGHKAGVALAAMLAMQQPSQQYFDPAPLAAPRQPVQVHSLWDARLSTVETPRS